MGKMGARPMRSCSNIMFSAHQWIEAYLKGAENAKLAGFDGVEIHGANGYLLMWRKNWANVKSLLFVR